MHALVNFETKWNEMEYMYFEMDFNETMADLTDKDIFDLIKMLTLEDK